MLKNRKIWNVGYFLLAFMAFISVAQGLNNALIYSQDFQWSPSVLFWDGINPYNYYLNGNEENRIILSQAPNYLHSTYIFLYPFTLLDWESAKVLWALSSLLFAVISVWFLCHTAGCTFYETLFVACIFFCSTPLRNSIGSGQHSTLVLLAFCGFFLKRGWLGDLSIGFGFFKYSFMPPLFLYLFFVKGIKSFAFLIIPSVIGWLAFSIYIGSSPFETLMLPLKVSSYAVSNGLGDLMTILALLANNFDSVALRALSYLMPVALSFLFAYYLSKNPSEPLYIFSIISVSSLILFKHLAYDYVFLLPAFIYALKSHFSRESGFALAVILFNWFGLKFIHHIFLISNEDMLPINFILLLSLVLVLMRIRIKEDSLLNSI